MYLCSDTIIETYEKSAHVHCNLDRFYVIIRGDDCLSNIKIYWTQFIFHR